MDLVGPALLLLLVGRRVRDCVRAKELLTAADAEELEKFREARARRTHYLARGAADNVFKPMLARAVKTMSNRRRFVQEFFTTERK